MAEIESNSEQVYLIGNGEGVPRRCVLFLGVKE